MTAKRVVVIGGGMAGIAAARALKDRGIDPLLLEKDDQLGGRVRTVTIGRDIAVDVGAGFITDRYECTLNLIRETGMLESLTRLKHDYAVGGLEGGKTLSVSKSAGLLRVGSLLPLSMKTRLLPIGLDVIRNWRLLSLREIHAAASLDTRSVKEEYDDSRGRRLLDRLILPVLNGFFYWTPEQTSNAMLLMLWRLALGMREFYTLQGGLQRLATETGNRLSFRTGHEVVSVRRSASSSGFTVRARRGNDEVEILADGVVCATPAWKAQNFASCLTDAGRDCVENVKYSSTVVATYHLNRAIPAVAHGTAFAQILTSELAFATTLSKSGRSDIPTGQDVLSLFASGTSGPQLCDASDEEVDRILSTAAIRADSAFSTSINRLSYRVDRWRYALPIFEVGHLRRLHALAGVNGTNGFALAGDYIGGPFIEGAVRSGVEAAEKLANWLEAAPATRT
ncbi:FAD-dependent oxidoreductase [Geodermatophilus sp. URMC 65]